MTRRARGLPAGFTLLELLVGVAILGLIAAVLAATLNLGRAGIERADAAAADMEALRTLDGTLRRTLATAVPVVAAQRRDDSILFAGAREEVRFVMAPVAGARDAGLRLARLHVERRDGSRRLVLEHRRWLGRSSAGDGPAGAGTGEEDAERVVLIEGVAQARFDYFGTASPRRDARPGAADREGAWHDDWEGNALPRLVRLRLRGEDGRDWPPLVVAPLLDPELR